MLTVALTLVSFFAVITISTPYSYHQARHVDPLPTTEFNPHWISNSEFWFRRDLGLGRHEFVIVDATSGHQRIAFDHKRVAYALRKRDTAIDDEIHHQNLPFKFIGPSINGATIQFRIGAEALEYSTATDSLSPADLLVEHVLEPLKAEIPSSGGGSATGITFINNTPEKLNIFWIDTEGNAKAYGTIDADKAGSLHIDTYEGHVWRAQADNGRVYGVYKAETDESVAHIDAKNSQLYDMGNPVPPTGSGNATKPFQWPKGTPEGIFGNAGRAFVRGGNVFVRDGEKLTQISTTGTKDSPFRFFVHHSPDGKFASAWQYDKFENRKVTFVVSSPKTQVQPTLRTIDYPKPGDKMSADRPRIFDLDAKKEIDASNEAFKNPYEITNIGWSKDSKEYRFMFNERGHQRLAVLGMDAKTGKVRTLVEDTQKTFIDYSSKTYWHVIPGTDDFLWMSERDGHNHLYLFDLATGNLKNQITKGEYVVRQVEKVDDKTKQIWFKGFGLVKDQDWYHAHLAVINFDGTGLKVLTSGDGTHSWKWNPDRSKFTDTYSRVDVAPTSIVRDGATGSEITVVINGKNDTAKQLRGYLAPERFVAPGRDGKTSIYGIIIKPKSFDASKKYPIIEQIYAGPQDFFVPKTFGPLSRQREWADQGFVLVQIDGMGTNWRSKKFHDNCAGNLKDAGFLDRIAWMKAAAATRPYMDISRVGVYGGSAGGQNAMAAVLWHSDFYKAAAADSGCHDNRMDKRWWNEQWLGANISSPGYIDSSNTVHAGKLGGALMLMVGETDTNVDPSSTYQVVNALNLAQKDYEYLFVPNGDHGSGSDKYGRRRQLDFFKWHLLGEKPPSRNRGGK